MSTHYRVALATLAALLPLAVACTPNTSGQPAKTVTRTVVVTKTVTASAAAEPSASAPVSTTAAQKPIIYDCGGRAVAQPTSFVLTCADANTELRHLHWTGWGSANAQGTGELWQNSCSPDCADGSNVPYPASVTVSTLSSGGSRYTFMHVNAPQAPGGPYDYTLRTSGPA